MAQLPWRKIAGLFIPLTLLLALGALPAELRAEPSFPALTGRIVDEAKLLDEAQHAQLGAQLAELEAKSSDQLVVVTVPSLQGYDIETYGYQLGRHWGIGTAKLDNGALLIVAPNERKVRIEVGYGLEPVLTDAMSSLIIENAILPRFRQGDYPGGISDGVRDIVATLTGNAEEVEERARSRPAPVKGTEVDLHTVILWAIIILWILYNFGFFSGLGLRPGSRGRNVGWGGGWGGGGGGRSSGGGFSGGGGSFGGGGASGGW